MAGPDFATLMDCRALLPCAEDLCVLCGVRPLHGMFLSSLSRCPACADNITGGFAGGEKGLQQFIEKGDVEIAETAQKGDPICMDADMVLFDVGHSPGGTD